MAQQEMKWLETELDEILSGNGDYDRLLNALGRALAEQLEVFAVRSAQERELPDGTYQVELLKVQSQLGETWLCFTGKQHLDTLIARSGPIKTAQLSFRTLCSMAEVHAVDAIVLNPEQLPNICIGRAELEEIRIRAERYLESCREQRLRQAAAQTQQGWIL